jgi:predicted nuclease of predicted toxin-antitoxin system
VKLLLDENLSHKQAALLRNDGYDAAAVVELGLSGEPDEVIRAFAIDQKRVLITLDSDFANMLRFPPFGTPGVIRLKVHPPAEEAIRKQIIKVLHA